MLAYRAREGMIGEAFMTTHSFAEEKLKRTFKTLVLGYNAGNETMRDACRTQVSVFLGAVLPFICLARVPCCGFHL